MRPTKILLRLKGDRSQVKAFVNVRDRNKSHPKQLHLAYLNIHQDLDTVKSRIFCALVEKWPRNRKPREIDWQDAENKLSKLRLIYSERERPRERQSSDGSPSESNTAAPLVPALEPSALVASLPEAPIASAAASSQSLLRPTWEAELVALMPELTAMASRLTSSAADADDLVQATLESALRSRFAGHNLRAWLFGVMRHRFIDAVRSANRVPFRVDIDEISDLLVTQSEEPEEPWQKFSLNDLRELQHSIPHWIVFEMIYIDKLSYQKAADVLGIQVNTLSSRLNRARQRIRALLMSRARSSGG